MEKARFDKNEILPNEQKKKGEALLEGSLQHSKVCIEEVHRRAQDILVMYETKEEKRKVSLNHARMVEAP